MHLLGKLSKKNYCFNLVFPPFCKQFAGMLDGDAASVPEHAGNFFLPVFSLQPLYSGNCPAAPVFLVNHKMAVRSGGNYRLMCYADDLPVPCQLFQFFRHRLYRYTAYTGVYFIKDGVSLYPAPPGRF